jgi:hypothetical protein
MNGTSTTARRRAYRSAASTASANSDDCHQNICESSSYGQKNDGRRGMSYDTKLHEGQVIRFSERKNKNISRVKQLCTKLGRLRVADVALFVGLAAKLSSFVYSQHTCPTPSSSMRNVNVQSDSPKLESQLFEVDSSKDEMKSLSDRWPFPKWVQRWVERKMPFHSPLLYRRDDDDYSYGYGSYLDDDGFAIGVPRQKIKFRGMFLREEHDNEEQLNGHGYAVVDDLVYYADEYSDETRSALASYDFQVNPPHLAKPINESHPAFEFRNDEKNHRHYFTDDGLDTYYAFDDDIQRGTKGMGLHPFNQDQDNQDQDSQDDDELVYVRHDEHEQGVCTPPEFYRTYQPTCNEIHASLSGYHWLIGEDIYSRRWKKRKYSSPEESHLSKYLSHGYYRDAFLFRQSFVPYAGRGTEWDEVVFKTMQHLYESDDGASTDDQTGQLSWDSKDKYTFLHYIEDMRKDAMVMELLSSSPRVIDIYSHCAMSSVTEFAPTDMEAYIMPTDGYTPKSILRGTKRNDDSERPLNDHISPEEKLEVALEMAKCVAVLHGFKDGPIVHVDVKTDQFFRGRDGIIKMIDYNRAEALLYDTENGGYCKWTNGRPADVNVSQQ